MSILSFIRGLFSSPKKETISKKEIIPTAEEKVFHEAVAELSKQEVEVTIPEVEVAAEPVRKPKKRYYKSKKSNKTI